MSKFSRKIAAAGTALAIATLSVACTQETPDAAYDDQATDTETTMENETLAMDDEATMDTRTPTMDDQAYGETSTMDDQASMAAQEEASQVASTLGVSELNEIENWKITSDGEELGEIDRIGIDRSTGELLAVVGLEGVVGVNMKEVAVPLKSLEPAGDESLTTNLTMDELQQKRDIDPWDDSQVSTENVPQ